VSVFGPEYADAYDLLYADKEYEAECVIIERLCERFGRPGPKSVLDLGCGTGRHAVILARRGHVVHGVDISEAMLDIARSRAAAQALDIPFLHGDVRSFRAGRTFDIVLLMFAVLGYQLSDEDVDATLDTAAAHLMPGGLLIFDCWYGPAVEAIGPTSRVKVLRLDDGELVRTATGRLNGDGTCTVNYELVRRTSEAIAATSETHRMRYFARPELQERLAAKQFQLLDLKAFPEMSDPTSESWNVLAVGRKQAAEG